MPHLRRGSIFVTLTVGFFLMVVAVAWACVPQATVELERDQAAAGETVEGTGNGFDRASAVEVHLDAKDGPLLWSGDTNLNGQFSFAFEVPGDAQPGHHVVVAYHPGSEGDPAKTLLEVTSQPAGQGEGEPAPADDRQQQGQPAPAQEEQQEPAPAEQPAAQDEPAEVAEPAPQPAAAQAPAEEPAQAPAGEARQAPAQAGHPIEGGVTDEAAPAEGAQARQPVAGDAEVVDGEATVGSGPSDGMSVLGLAMLGLGVLLTVGGTATVVASRSRREALARTPRKQ